MGNTQGWEMFFGFAGISLSMGLSNLGAAYGMAKSGAGVAGMGQRKPNLIIKSLLPVVMASILGIYGLIVSVVILKKIDLANYNMIQGYKHFGAGLCCGFSSLAAGYAIGLVGDAGVRAYAQQEKLFIGLVLVLIFAEAIGLFGMIVAIMVVSK